MRPKILKPESFSVVLKKIIQRDPKGYLLGALEDRDLITLLIVLRDVIEFGQGKSFSFRKRDLKWIPSIESMIDQLCVSNA